MSLDPDQVTRPYLGQRVLGPDRGVLGNECNELTEPGIRAGRQGGREAAGRDVAGERPGARQFGSWLMGSQGSSCELCPRRQPQSPRHVVTNAKLRMKAQPGPSCSPLPGGRGFTHWEPLRLRQSGTSLRPSHPSDHTGDGVRPVRRLLHCDMLRTPNTHNQLPDLAGAAAPQSFLVPSRPRPSPASPLGWLVALADSACS